MTRRRFTDEQSELLRFMLNRFVADGGALPHDAVARAVVEAARSEDSPLHPLLNWQDHIDWDDHIDFLTSEASNLLNDFRSV